MMCTRTRRNFCYANVLGADKKAALLIAFDVRGGESTLSCILVYEKDSKDFYQPEYKFQVIVNGSEDSVLIPAVKLK